MTDPQYRVIADKDTTPDLVSADAAPGDRLVYDVIDDDRWSLVRIERPLSKDEQATAILDLSAVQEAAEVRQSIRDGAEKYAECGVRHPAFPAVTSSCTQPLGHDGSHVSIDDCIQWGEADLA